MKLSRLIKIAKKIIFKQYKLLQLLDEKIISANQLTQSQARDRIRNHLKGRRERGEIQSLPTRPKIFIAVSQCNWEKSALVDPWCKFGDIVHYDWSDEFDQYAGDWHSKRKKEFNDKLYTLVYDEHKKSKIDIFFSYLSGRWVYGQTIKKIRDLGIITINYDFDDSLKFWGYKEASGLTGSAEIAPFYDICISAQSEANVGKYVAVGSNPVFMPSGGNPDVFAKLEPKSERKISVSFIGQNYGERKKIIRFLAKNGINIFARGKGFDQGAVSQDEMLEIYNDSLLTLGFGYIANTYKTGLKGRDFEVPMTGTAYLTTYNEELTKYFIPDKEIILYYNKEDLLKKIKYYSANPEKIIEIGQAGRARALKDHTWLQRWAEVLELIK